MVKMAKGKKKTTAGQTSRFRFVPPYSSSQSSDNKGQTEQRVGTAADTVGNVYAFDEEVAGDSQTALPGNEPSTSPSRVRSGGHGNAEKAAWKGKGGRKGEGGSQKITKGRKKTGSRGQGHTPFLTAMDRLRTELANIRQRQRFLERVLHESGQTHRHKRSLHPPSPTTTTTTPTSITSLFTTDGGDDDDAKKEMPSTQVTMTTEETVMTSSAKPLTPKVSTRDQSRRSQLLLKRR
ncbi:hypothetical protein ACOMHN_049818 [Nucella lapillus]